MKAKFMIIALMAMIMMTACGSRGVSEMPAEVPAETDINTEATVDQGADIQESVLQNNPADIGPEKVKQIVLAKVPGAVETNIYEFEKDYDNGRIEYEGSLYHDGYEYEFEIDGATGNILKWEIDY